MAPQSGSNRALQRETHPGADLPCAFNARAAALCPAAAAWLPEIRAFPSWPRHGAGEPKGSVQLGRDLCCTKGRLVWRGGSGSYLPMGPRHSTRPGTDSLNPALETSPSEEMIAFYIVLFST